MTASQHRKGPVSLGELVGRAIEPVTAKRGFAAADLIATWPEIAGPLYANCTVPEKIVWPRKNADDQLTGVLFLKAEGPRAVLVQHDLPQILERVNAFFGYRAIGQVRIVQGPVTAQTPATQSRITTLDSTTERALAEQLGGIDDDRLKAALARLGRGIHGSRNK